MKQTTWNAQIRVSERRFPVPVLWEQREGHCPLLRLWWGGVWEITELHFSHTHFPSQLSPLHIQRPFSDWHRSSDPSLQLEERTSPCLWKLLDRSPAFCAGREPERNSRGQDQDGEDQGHQGIFRISFSGQPRISPSIFCADPRQRWLVLLKKTPSLDLVSQSNQTTPGTWLALNWGKKLMVAPKYKSFLELKWTVTLAAMLPSFSYLL